MSRLLVRCFSHLGQKALSAIAIASFMFGTNLGYSAPQIGATSGPIAHVSPIQQPEDTAQGASVTRPIEFTLRTDRGTYKLGDEIRIEVLLTNRSSAPLYLYAGLDWGESASISVWLKDVSTGKEVPQEFIHDVVTPPPTSREAFIRLLPHHMYGAVLRSRLVTLNVQKKGTYELVGEYHSPVPESMSFGLPIWSREKGAVSSNGVVIVVGE